MNTVTFPETSKEVLKGKQKYTNSLETMKTVLYDLNTWRPEKIREIIDKKTGETTYDKWWEKVINGEKDIKDVTAEIDNHIKNFEECKSILKKLNDFLQEIKLTLNRGYVIELQELARDTIKQNNITTDNEIAQYVLDLKKLISHGGKGISKKNKNNMNNKTKRKIIKTRS
jgi:hypothetical protein